MNKLPDNLIDDLYRKYVSEHRITEIPESGSRRFTVCKSIKKDIRNLHRWRFQNEVLLTDTTQIRKIAEILMEFYSDVKDILDDNHNEWVDYYESLYELKKNI